MDDAERERRNAKAIGCFYRVKHAVFGASLLLVGVAIPLWLWSIDPSEGYNPGPWLAAAGCWIAGPLLLWQVVRRR